MRSAAVGRRGQHSVGGEGGASPGARIDGVGVVEHQSIPAVVALAAILDVAGVVAMVGVAGDAHGDKAVAAGGGRHHGVVSHVGVGIGMAMPHIVAAAHHLLDHDGGGVGVAAVDGEVQVCGCLATGRGVGGDIDIVAADGQGVVVAPAGHIGAAMFNGVVLGGLKREGGHLHAQHAVAAGGGVEGVGVHIGVGDGVSLPRIDALGGDKLGFSRELRIDGELQCVEADAAVDDSVFSVVAADGQHLVPGGSVLAAGNHAVVGGNRTRVDGDVQHRGRVACKEEQDGVRSVDCAVPRQRTADGSVDGPHNQVLVFSLAKSHRQAYKSH